MPLSRFHLLLLLPLAFAPGCEKPEIRVYTAPKDPPRVASKEEPGHEGHGHAPGQHKEEDPARPQLSYKMPEGWIVGPVGQVSMANFIIRGEGGEATVNITPLASFAGKEEIVVNMWRQQSGVPALSSQEAAKSLSPVEVGDQVGHLFEVAGSRDGKTSRMVTVMVHRPEGTWFYKLQGADAIVAAQKPVFLEFLKTVKIDAPAKPESAAPASASSTPSSPPPMLARPPESPAQPSPAPAATPAPASTPAPAPVATPAPAPAPTN